MNRLGPGIVLGAVFVLAGSLLLLERRGALAGVTDLLLGGLAVLAGLGLLVMLRGSAWWVAFPAFPLVAVGALLVFPKSISNGFGGPVVLGSIGLSFVSLYMRRRRGNWWAIIPAGVLATLAIVAGASVLVEDRHLGGLLLFGLAATFTAVALLARMRWAFYPAAALAAAGLLASSVASQLADYLLGGSLIVAGGCLVIQYARGRWVAGSRK